MVLEVFSTWRCPLSGKEELRSMPGTSGLNHLLENDEPCLESKFVALIVDVLEQ